METFLTESLSIYEQSWSVTGAISWMWRKLLEYSSGVDEDPFPAGRFVLRKNLEVYHLVFVVTKKKEAAAKILKHMNDVTSYYVGHIYSPQTFAKTFSSLFPCPLSKLDQLILLKYLSRDKKEIVCSATVQPPSSYSLI